MSRSKKTKVMEDLLREKREDIPMTEHDIPLGAIVTADEVIETSSVFARPKGIYWQMLMPEKIDEIPVLQAKRRLQNPT